MQTPAPSAASIAEAQRQAAERKQQREADERRFRARSDEAAEKALEIWDRASAEGTSAYLSRKGVGAHGVRFLPDGTLVVPLRDAAGLLQSIQFISPTKPTDGGLEKRFLSGSRKAGLWHWIGEPAGATVLLLAEGYATGAAVYEATGRPVAVAFDVGNLRNVAEVLATIRSDAALLVCGDDDHGTEAAKGKNPGRIGARSAVRLALSKGVRAAMVFPVGLVGDGTDFDDLGASHGASVVRDQVEAAIESMASVQPSDRKPQRISEQRDDIANSGDGGGGDDEEPPDDRELAEGDDGRPDAFRVDEKGVWFRAPGSDRAEVWICPPIFVRARTRDELTNAWGYLVEFHDPDGNLKKWAMPMSMLNGDSGEWAARLRDMGLTIATGNRPRSLLAQYIETRNRPERVTCVDRVGWHGGKVFVLPSRSYGAEKGANGYAFQSDGAVEDGFRQVGSLAEWQRKVAAPCAGNSRLVFALSCAFAGPVLKPAGLQGGVFHFVGGSSQGKTTALRAAVSAWGAPTFMQQWRSSDNGLEGVALQHSETLLALDEVGQLDPRLIGDAAYMLANGREKVRAKAAGGIRRVRTWTALVLSSGEKSMGDLMGETGKRVMAGQEVRFVDVPLDAGQGMGGLECLHGAASASEFVAAVTRAAARSYGTAGDAWLNWLTGRPEKLPAMLRELIDQCAAQLLPLYTGEQVRRVAMRFALVAAAGELATEAGVTGWQPGESTAAVKACFKAWSDTRGHLGNSEEATMLRQVQGFIETHGEARFTLMHRAMDDRNPKTMNRVGFRREVDAEGVPIKPSAVTDYMDARSTYDSSDRHAALFEYYVLPEAFRTEVCKGFSPDAVARVLQAKGHLIHEPNRLTTKPRLPGLGTVRCYGIRPNIFGDALGSQPGAEP